MKSNNYRNSNRTQLNKNDLPIGWTFAHMKDIAKYINGRAFKPTEWQIHGKPIIRIQNLTGSTKTLNHYSGDVDDKYLIYDGDVLISWSATLGVYVYRGEPAILNQHIFKVLPYIDKFFIFYLVLNVLNDLKKKVHGTGIQHIKQKPFENHPVSIPPLNEQKRIVAKIESIFGEIDACKARLERLALQTKSGTGSLAQLKSSILKQAFEGRLVPQDPNDEPAEMLLRKLHKGNEIEFEKKGLPKGWIKTSLTNIAIINPKKPTRDTVDGSLEVTFLPMKCVEEVTGNVTLENIKKYDEVWRCPKNGQTGVNALNDQYLSIFDPLLPRLCRF